MLSLHSTKPQHEVDFLLAGSGEGVGALAFSLSRHQAKKKIAKNQFVDLQSLTQSKNDVLAHNSLSAEAKKALEYGISMGGCPGLNLLCRTAIRCIWLNLTNQMI